MVARDQARGAPQVSGTEPSPLATNKAVGSAAMAPHNQLAVPGADGALARAVPQNGFLNSARSAHLTIEHNQNPNKSSSAIHGTVTDPSGAIIARASVTLRAISGATAATTSTDQSGRFELPSVTPGQYQLQISAPGFRTDTERFDLQGGDLASLSPALQVGSSAASVEVSAAATDIPTNTHSADARLAALVPVLPGRLPATTTVVRSGRILALDTAGTLFLSRNGGRKWKKVPPVWSGSIAHLGLAEPGVSAALHKAEPSRTTPPLFELTSTDGAVWISSDGVHWRLR
ncbi:MAG TPA: carboxypeptidase-like regulatory domain-containing protein [Acidobacteriaceae bacterium]|nr:carboxypeptidase-like regulatory domain-containing protein [Acidobacteriaceae bacterium]